MEQLFDKIHFDPFRPLPPEQIRQFAQMVSRIVDFRSKFTAAHSQTVSRLALFIGGALGLNEDECFKLSIAGLFHDIGKIGIDTAYIEKKGPLTEEEYNQVKLHSYYTGQILNELASADWFSDIVIWSREHHERLDGQGYPLSLSGDDIPLGARIIAYADVLSALMEDRPYRKGLNVDMTLEIIATKFAQIIDPEIFSVLQQYKVEIDHIINNCHQETRKVFYNSVENF